MIVTRIRLAACALAMATLAGSETARALENPFPDNVIVAPGVKLGYTFGSGGGFTFGGELSMLFRNGPDAGLVLAHGPAVNAGWASGGIFQFRAGYEVASWSVGLEAGPGLVSDAKGTHFSLGFTPWLGAIFVAPYYTHSFVFGARDVNELGAYLKLPLCFGCPGGGSHHGSVFGGIGHDHHH
jgi:hypothetical protein